MASQQQKDEKRLGMRSDVVQTIKDYYDACLDAGYPFEDDICDMVYDATDGSITVVHDIGARE